MTTKYLLHGGETASGLKDSPEFFQSLLDIDKPAINVLLVYFARTSDQWQYLSSEDQEYFISATNKKLNFKIANQNTFEDNTKWADIIYVKGGDGPRLTESLSHYPNLQSLFEGRTVGAISAGANALSEAYYSRKGRRVIEGLGVIPVKVFTHYETNLQPELEELDNFGQPIKIVTLPEGEFESFEF
jgi:hypothetical protein